MCPFVTFEDAAAKAQRYDDLAPPPHHYMKDLPLSLAGKLHAYLDARRHWTEAGLRDDGAARKLLEQALEAFEAAIPTDADMFFIRDAAGHYWACEYGRHRMGGPGIPDSSYPTISRIEDLVVEDVVAERAA